MPVFESPEALQAHRVVSQRVRDLQVVQDAAGRVEELLSTDNPCSTSKQT
jgi:hypothetical protein